MSKGRIIVISIFLLALALAVLPLATVNVNAAIIASISASPNPINETQNTVLTFTMTGGTANGAYTFRIYVTKPGGGGQDYYDMNFNANSTGGTTQAVLYYNQVPPWTTSGVASTDIPGTYSVRVDETAPKAATNMASTTFTVVNNLKVTIISPGSGSSYQRGNSTRMTVTVYDIQNNPVSSAQVSASTPSGTIPLPSSSPPGTYRGVYTIQPDDPLGNWNITATAYWPTSTNNIGYYSVVSSITPEQLVISTLSTYNQFGTPTSDFSPGDTLYASFVIGYSPGRGYLTSGTFTVTIENPSGATVTTLQTIYDSTRGLFYTPSGFPVSSTFPAGSWELVFPARSANDTYGNIGPSTTITYTFQVHQTASQVVINPFYYMIAALALGGGLGTTVFLKRFNSTTGPFDDLFKLTGGEMQPPSTLMIYSDSGAGSTTMALQLLQRDLAKGKSCGFLSYDAFPSEISKRMRDMGWDIADYLKSGQLKILDCYSALAGVEGSLIKDPTDFTEVSIQVTSMIEKAKGPVTILLDSVTPIFNAAAAKDCINFLQVLGAKVKNNGGIFIFTATKGAIPEEARSKIEALADGVIELNLIKKANSLKRTLQVKKMAGHQSSPIETGFEIVQGKGVVIRKQRIPIGIFRA